MKEIMIKIIIDEANLNMVNSKISDLLSETTYYATEYSISQRDIILNLEDDTNGQS